VFVTARGSAYARLKRAIASGNVLVAWTTAGELPKVPLSDALALVLLVRDRSHWRYPPAALRWHARLCAEARLSMDEAHLALAALAVLGTGGPEPGARALRALCEAHGLDDARRVLQDWLGGRP
jgi:hypothetical protein